MTEAVWIAKVYYDDKLLNIRLFKSRESAMAYADQRAQHELISNEFITDRVETHANTHDIYSAFATDGSGNKLEVVVELMKVWP